jgi:hypothetical protein
MHFRFLVTCNRDWADTSAKAREHVLDTLQEEGFCGQGRWGGGLADWFVIGGRWSGALSFATWAKDLRERFSAAEATHDVQVRGCHYGDLMAHKRPVQEQLAKQFQQMWDAAAPKAYVGIPYNRDNYQREGYADDAMLLTQELYDALLKEYEGQEESEYHADLEYEAVSPEMVGKKWLVVVDYHT